MNVVLFLVLFFKGSHLVSYYRYHTHPSLMLGFFKCRVYIFNDCKVKWQKMTSDSGLLIFDVLVLSVLHPLLRLSPPQLERQPLRGHPSPWQHWLHASVPPQVPAPISWAAQGEWLHATRLPQVPPALPKWYTHVFFFLFYFIKSSKIIKILVRDFSAVFSKIKGYMMSWSSFFFFFFLWLKKKRWTEIFFFFLSNPVHFIPLLLTNHRAKTAGNRAVTGDEHALPLLVLFPTRSL